MDGGNKQNDVAERLFKSYFTDGIQPNLDTILKIAREVGFDETEVRNYVTDQHNIDVTREKALSWSRKGVTGVPCFYMNGQRTFSGAQDPPAFLQMFDIVAKNSANM
ncbi:uncharacterized protein LOC106177194 [Lingula anatina]|uniref:Uncharacterized protein LOC106177194 n=1 Tax=Lingula anatina TaxID=7574 RepID=A0A1S3JZ50_LINAN|nr:uncharacterized protein LOC106177194 [Lingula anatina]|eukprot:XP_013415354.1 uncharacterized protein LOC106177194 [Lingula anatina]